MDSARVITPICEDRVYAVAAHDRADPDCWLYQGEPPPNAEAVTALYDPGQRVGEALDFLIHYGLVRLHIFVDGLGQPDAAWINTDAGRIYAAKHGHHEIARDETAVLRATSEMEALKRMETAHMAKPRRPHRKMPRPC